MNTPAFRNALLSLSHPVSILGIIVVLLNDHWWRRVAPSWFTGKIGDFAWLIFAPFLLALLLAWLFPRREKFVGAASIIGVGLIFGLAKTVPAFHALTLDVLKLLTGWPNVLRMDPTDLLSLPALLIAWWIWEQSATRLIRLPDRGWVLLPLAVFATMADSAAPNNGITCVEQVDNQVLTFAMYKGYYGSQDGGLSWSPTDLKMPEGSCERPLTEIADRANPLVHFRITAAGRQIERSDDGGQTWQAEYALQELSEAQQVYIARAEGGSPQFSQVTPGSMTVLDTATGNLIVAAAHQGVLVRAPDGAWQAIAVGDYRPVDLHQSDTLVSLLAGEILAAFTVAALAAGTMPPGQMTRTVRLLLLLAWLILGGAVGLQITFLQSGGYSRMGNQCFTYGVIIAGALASVVAVTRLMALFRLNPTAVWVTLGLSALTAVLFLVPFVVWTQNGIPYYVAAMLFAGLFVAAMCFAGYRYLRRYARAPQNLTTA